MNIFISVLTKKRWGSLVILIILVSGAVFIGQGLATASSATVNATATPSLLELQQLEINRLQNEIATSANPTDIYNLQRGLNNEYMRATAISNAETMAPTSWAMKQTVAVLMSSEPTSTPRPKVTIPTGLRPGVVNHFISRNVEMTGSWIEPYLTTGCAIIYYAGALIDTHQGAIVINIDSEGCPYYVEQIEIAEVTGKLTITGKNGNFLVLSKEYGGTIYFNTLTKQFTTAMVNGMTLPVNTLIPLPTQVSPDQSTPKPAYP